MLCICYRVYKDGDLLSSCTVRECLWGTKNYVVDDRCIVPPEIKMLSAAELAEKIAEYEQVLPPLKHNDAEIKLPIHIE